LRRESRGWLLRSGWRAAIFEPEARWRGLRNEEMLRGDGEWFRILGRRVSSD
jgi:hypothetical protein